MTRKELITRIELAKAELPEAGPIHSKDLRKHIHRLEVDLRRYDRYQQAARREVG